MRRFLARGVKSLNPMRAWLWVLVASGCSLEATLLPDGIIERAGVRAEVDVDGASVRLKLDNVGRRPVRLTYEDVSLDGKRHYGVMRSGPQRFVARGFFVAAPHRVLYPRLEPWPRPLHLELRAGPAGMPEGVLEPGGSLDGGLDFEPLERDEERVNFNLKLVDPDTGEQFGLVTVPVRDHTRTQVGLSTGGDGLLQGAGQAQAAR